MTGGGGWASLAPFAVMPKPPLQILPSLLAADFGHLADACRAAGDAGADALHLDVMDGHFVPNLTMGPDIVRVARKSAGIPLSVHLMCSRPAVLLDTFLDAGSDLILLHVEAQDDPLPLLEQIHNRGKRGGVVINPETPVEAVDPYLPHSDEVLLMTVHPGFGGQPFLDHVLPKITAIRTKAPMLDISVDGGITLQTAVACVHAGANVLIAGTSLYRASDLKAAVAQLRAACATART